MPLKKKYTFYFCKDCEIDFCLSDNKGKQGLKRFCPTCGENLFVEKIKTVWMERPFNYKRPYTDEEDGIILVSRKQGFTYKEISETLFNRTPQSVRRRLQQLKEKGVEI